MRVAAEKAIESYFVNGRIVASTFRQYVGKMFSAQDV
jgi:hypothetical protein